MLRGTQILVNENAKEYSETINVLKAVLLDLQYKEVVIPSIWEAGTFLGKIGASKEEQMWTFQDRGDRNVCLIPEVTGIIQEMWNAHWSETWPKPSKIFYVSRCYRYERPQLGRYREFTQLGVEFLGPVEKTPRQEVVESLLKCLYTLNVEHLFIDSVSRGLGYYIEDGFEVECPILGAQKQVAGGGRYKEGIGWAIGIERLIIAKNLYEEIRYGSERPSSPT